MHCLSLDATSVALQYSGKMDVGIRSCALRLLSRLIVYACKRKLKQERVPMDAAWPIILHEMENSDDDEQVRTAAVACALEGIVDGSISQNAPSPGPVEEISKALVNVLRRAVRVKSPRAALPSLLALGQLAAMEEEEAAARALATQVHQEGLIKLLACWLPRAAEKGNTAIERAAAAAAAACMAAVTERGASLGPLEMEMLLKLSMAPQVEVALRDSCESALRSAVDVEQEADMLAKLLATRLEESVRSGKRLMITEVVQAIGRRIVHLVKVNNDRLTEPLLFALDRVEAAVTGNKEAGPLLVGIANVRSIAGLDTGLEQAETENSTDRRKSMFSATSGGLESAGRPGSAATGASSGFSKTSPAAFGGGSVAGSGSH